LSAFILSYVIRAFNQPIVVGYIIAGMVVAFILEYGVIDIGATSGLINIFSQLGIAFLLFIVGLHLNPRVIKEVGTSSLLIGLAQIVFTFAVGFLISFKLLGFNMITSAYIAIALAFSSTIIIMKLLSDKKKLDSLYGKISIGILIIQDLVAVAVLMFISSMSGEVSFGSFALKGLLSGGGLIIALFLIGFFILPRVVKNIAKNQELLFLFSICWCFVIAALFSYFGFSIEIGALVAGVVLSISPYSTEISSKIRPLRDFFLIIFFIILGLNLHISNIGSIIVNALILSLVVLIFKPFILMVFMAVFRYTRRTNFLLGTTMAQISEFSLIILALGVSVGHISGEVLSTLTLTGIITIGLSTYMIIYSEKFYQKVEKIVSIFERKKIKKEKRMRKKYDAILFGYNRMGFSILNSFKKMKKSCLVVDFNPDIIANLTKLRVPCVYGDAYDSELLRELPVEKTKLVISTIPDFETNILLMEAVRLENPDAILIVRAHQVKEAVELYKKGANYVLTPHFIGGEYVAKMINELKMNEGAYKAERKKHLKMLSERLKKSKRVFE